MEAKWVSYSGVNLRWPKSGTKILFSVQKFIFSKSCVSMPNFMGAPILAQKNIKITKQREKKEEQKFCTVRSILLFFVVKVL